MKGLIVDIKDNRAIVLKDDGTFVNIKSKNYKIGQKVKTSSNAFVNSLKIAACLALCILTSTIAYKFYYTPYSYLYIDINPSVRLDLNYFDIVIDCTPLNTDAEFIEVSSGNVEDSIDEVITKCEKEGFLTEENNEIEINISKNTDKIRGSVFNIENKYKSTKYNVVVKDTTDEESEKANEQGISVKRQRAIEEFSTVFGGDEKQNAEKLQDKTTKEIDMLISNRQKEGAAPEVKIPQTEVVVPEKNEVKKPAKKEDNTVVESDKTVSSTTKKENIPVAEKPKKEYGKVEHERQKEQTTIPEKNEKDEQGKPKEDIGETVSETEKKQSNDDEGEYDANNTKPYYPPEKTPEKKPAKEPEGNMGGNIKEPAADADAPEKGKETVTDTVAPEKEKKPTEETVAPEKKPAQETAVAEKKPVKEPADTYEDQDQAPVKGEGTQTSAGVPTNTKQKELP